MWYTHEDLERRKDDESGKILVEPPQRKGSCHQNNCVGCTLPVRTITKVATGEKRVRSEKMVPVRYQSGLTPSARMVHRIAVYPTYKKKPGTIQSIHP